MKVQRGTFLSVLIVAFAAAISLVTVAFIFIPGIEVKLGSLPDWFNLFLVPFLLVRLVALYAIWKWKKWGVYLLLLMECTEVGLGLFVFTGVLTFAVRLAGALPSFLLLLAVWYLALKDKWQAFA